MSISYYLDRYLRQRPLFLSLIRAKEADLYQKYLPLATPVVDLGCGDGFFAKTTFGHLNIGLDLADSRINQATLSKTYAKLVTYDGITIPLKSNSVSTVVSNCVLEHVALLSGVLKESQRILKPGGKMLVTVMARPWEEYLVGNLFLGSTYKNWMRRKQVHLNLLSSKEWHKAFQKAGFKVELAEGYLSPSTCRLLDVAHYLSLPSLVIYVLTGHWTLTPKVNFYPTNWLAKIISEPVGIKDSGAIFFVLTKPHNRQHAFSEK